MDTTFEAPKTSTNTLNFFQNPNRVLSTEQIAELRPLLNSQRIESLFGSYGVDVLYEDEELRVSNLHSIKNESKVMRTCAIVNYLLPVAESLSEAHKLIQNGSSIGKVLKDNGFKITKKPIYFGEVNLPLVAKAHMNVDSDSAAVHIYCLCVSNEEINIPINYCTIIEIHSPKYLTSQSLAKLYPEDHLKYNEVNDQVKPYPEKIAQLDSILRETPVLQ